MFAARGAVAVAYKFQLTFTQAHCTEFQTGHIQSLPDDSLDFILTSKYNHSTEQFADKVDVFLQPETIGCETWRRLRNTCDKLPSSGVPMGHPLRRGGIHERRSPFSVKLMNSGVHSSQTNPGFSRQPAGGAIFFY
uniref:Uncharacterized protein n=1 Tax=Bombyx mori TaxID=7091 RepID=A0A8R2M2F1_BOMMO|nr:protein C1orf194 homolog isoform X2 [Bombyx mori]